MFLYLLGSSHLDWLYPDSFVVVAAETLLSSEAKPDPDRVNSADQAAKAAWNVFVDRAYFWHFPRQVEGGFIVEYWGYLWWLHLRYWASIPALGKRKVTVHRTPKWIWKPPWLCLCGKRFSTARARQSVPIWAGELDSALSEASEHPGRAICSLLSGTCRADWREWHLYKWWRRPSSETITPADWDNVSLNITVEREMWWPVHSLCNSRTIPLS